MNSFITRGLVRCTAISTLILCSALAHAQALQEEKHDHDHPQTIRFVENKGQWPEQVNYCSKVGMLSLFAEDQSLTWSMWEAEAGNKMHDFAHLSKEEQAATSLRGHAWKVHFIDANTDPSTRTEEKAPFYHNYFLGNDRSKWASHVSLFGAFTYEELWPGVDMKIYGSHGSFKYDLLLNSGNDAAQIGFRYEGLKNLQLTDAGTLTLSTSVGQLFEMAPVAWYADDPSVLLDCRYLVEGNELRYQFPNGYDANRAIVIDPVLIASTLSGSTGASNYGHCATFDDQGNIYSGARNFGPTYPATTGAFQTNFGGGGTDMAFSKYTPDGSNLLWASYLGGSAGENPHSMIVDSQGKLCVLGTTSSSDYPVSTNAYDPSIGGSTDITVTVFSSDGATLHGSTYLGGSNDDGTNAMYVNYGETYRGEILLDAQGNVLVASCSASSDFPVSTGAVGATLAGGQDGVVFSLNTTCSNLLWSTYLGGTSDDNALGIRTASNGDIIVCGATDSQNMPMTTGGYSPTHNGVRDAYVIRMNSDATSILASTFYGGNDEDLAHFIDLDQIGNIFIYGQTSGGISIQPAGTYGVAGANIFIAKFSSDLSTNSISTTIGASGGFGYSFAPVAFLVDVCDNVYICGFNSATGLLTTPDAFYNSGSFYLSVFDPDITSVLFSTYYGGSHVDGGTSRFDKNGFVYQGVCSGTGSLQTTPNAWATTQNIGWDVGVFKIDLEQAGVQAFVNTNSPSVGCVPATFTFFATGSATSYSWDLGDGSPIVNDTTVTHTYTQSGTYIITLVGVDTAACNYSDTTFYTVVVNDPGQLDPGFTFTQTIDCTINEVTLTDTTSGAGLIAGWDMGDGTILSGSPVIHQYTNPGTYNVTLFLNDTLCQDSAQITIPITVFRDTLIVDIGPDVVICPGQSTILSAPFPGGTYAWNTGATTQSITVDQADTYWLNVDFNGCVGSDTLVVSMAPDPGALGFETRVCPDTEVQLTIPVNGGTYQWQIGGTTQSITVDTVGTYIFTVIDQYGCTYQDTAHVLHEDGAFDVIIPNVFTPNADGVNDKFKPVTNGSNDVEVQIFNRWGMEMFYSSNLSQLWNGKHEGEGSVSDGTYFYIIKYKNACKGEIAVETGHVTVLR